MLNKTRSIVLHHLRYGESSLIVTLYTERFGRLTCMVSGVRSKKSRFPATLFQPLTLLETDLHYRQNHNLQRLKEASCTFPYNSIPLNVGKSTMALFLAEVMYLTLREEESNPTLFSFLYHALQLFDTKETAYTNFHLWLMLHLTRFLGFFPAGQDIAVDGRVSSEGQAIHTLNAEQAAILHVLLKNPQGPPDELSLSKADRTQLLESLIRYYSQHIDGFSRLKSFAVLREVFG